jgi:hypothetical protein
MFGGLQFGGLFILGQGRMVDLNSHKHKVQFDYVTSSYGVIPSSLIWSVGPSAGALSKTMACYKFHLIHRTRAILVRVLQRNRTNSIHVYILIIEIVEAKKSICHLQGGEPGNTVV